MFRYFSRQGWAIEIFLHCQWTFGLRILRQLGCKKKKNIKSESGWLLFVRLHYEEIFTGFAPHNKTTVCRKITWLHILIWKLCRCTTQSGCKRRFIWCSGSELGQLWCWIWCVSVRCSLLRLSESRLASFCRLGTNSSNKRVKFWTLKKSS